MSDLDKAIRDRLQTVRVHMGEHRNAQFDDGVDPLFNDAGELGAAVQAVLDLHVPIDVHDMDAGGEPPPTPARREPRMWRHGVHTDIDEDVNEVTGTTTGRHWQRMPGKQYVWTSSGVNYSAGTVLYVENEVAEVVTPEGTP